MRLNTIYVLVTFRACPVASLKWVVCYKFCNKCLLSWALRSRAMAEFAVLAGASCCPPSCSGRTSSTCMSAIGLSRVRNPVNSGSRCGAFVRGSGHRNWRSVAVRAQERSSESGVSWMSKGSPYSVLGVSPIAARKTSKSPFGIGYGREFFMLKQVVKSLVMRKEPVGFCFGQIKEFHPDVYKGAEDADAITQRIIRAYEMLTNESVERIYRRKNMDPFAEPECEAEDVFVFEMNCIGRGCPYPCVGRAPDIFKFAGDTGCARAAAQRGPGQGEDYDVQLAVGQCPRNCIYWVTPMQREVLEDLMERALEGLTYSSEVVTLEALITRANYENGMYRPPKLKRKPTSSDQWVDWF